MKVAVIGGGLLGLSIAYELSKRADYQVNLFEGANQLGGVAGSMPFAEAEVDRFYHCILNSDRDVLQLIDEVGLSDKMRFTETKQGFYHAGKLYPMTSPLELLKFPPLKLIDRLRLAYTIVHCRLFIKNWTPLERLSVEKWLVRLGGRRTYENIWKPLLNAKFDGEFGEVPATYIWSRLVRVTSTRDKKTAKELSGHIIGGYQTLVDAMARAITVRGGRILTGAIVNEIVLESNEVRGLKTAEGFEEFDLVIATTPSQIISKLLPNASLEYRQSLEDIPYLGIVCLLLALNRSLIPYYTLNITDTRIPFTAVIETTTMIDPQYVADNHLVYLPKYLMATNPLTGMSDEEVKEKFLSELQAMFPQFERNWIIDARVMRERFVEPLHSIHQIWQAPALQTPYQNLYLANTTQIWPELTNGQSVTTYGRKVAQQLAERLSGKASTPAHAPL
ncbi:NAD(P)/FAD-dependent oxidoreductase [Candidatus Chlorohelix sp.]|uniref:NAD(P)/FAD-dependent oxidoreductase n=1 Tax=Candidatus Chlorohelix sp. TaxID=3139201 RepID=UPI003030F7AD